MNSKKYYSQTWVLPALSQNKLLALSESYLGQRFFWQTPDNQEILLGLGYLKTYPGLTWEKLAQAKENLLTKWVNLDHKSQPCLFGGGNFDANKAPSQFWGDLQAGMFVLPEILVIKKAQTWQLCLTVQASDIDKAKFKLQTLKAKFDKQLLKDKTYQLKNAYQGQLNSRLLAESQWLKAAQKTIAMLKKSQTCQKVVLARCEELTAKRFEMTQLLYNLLTLQPNTYRFLLETKTHCFIGATPERLLKATPTYLQTASVAGTTLRSLDPKENQRLMQALLADAKNTEEHQIVVNWIKQQLAQFVEQVQVSEREVLQNKNLQHLFLTLRGQRNASANFLDAVQKLHPTPALGGMPQTFALEWIRQVEPASRAMYGAPLGWLSLTEDAGEFSVAIRSAIFDLQQAKARLYAGCGILAASDAQAELAETKAKFKPIESGVKIDGC